MANINLLVNCEGKDSNSLYEDAFIDDEFYPPIAKDYTSVGKFMDDLKNNRLPEELKKYPHVLVYSARENRFYIVFNNYGTAPCIVSTPPPDVCNFIGKSGLIGKPSDNIICGGKDYPEMTVRSDNRIHRRKKTEEVKSEVSHVTDIPMILADIIAETVGPCSRLTREGRLCGRGKSSPYIFEGHNCRDDCKYGLCADWLSHTLFDLPAKVSFAPDIGRDVITRDVIFCTFTLYWMDSSVINRFTKRDQDPRAHREILTVYIQGDDYILTGADERKNIVPIETGKWPSTKIINLCCKEMSKYSNIGFQLLVAVKINDRDIVNSPINIQFINRNGHQYDFGFIDKWKGWGTDRDVERHGTIRYGAEKFVPFSTRFISKSYL